jgi:hypothetical protein
MNALIVGSDKTPILRYLPDRFLLIDDGPIIDQLRVRARQFDVTKHTFNPLKDMTYRKARDFADVLDAVFPEGESTLTARRSRYQILRALLSKPRTLDTLVSDTKDTEDAYQKVQTLLLSPVLKRVLNTPSLRFPFTGTITVRLDRAELGDFDAFVLGNLIISQYQGPVVIPDFGFYACGFHTALIRQDRLIAGVTSFDEVPSLRSQLLQIETKVGSRCTLDDAETLARYAGVPKIPEGPYRDFIERNIRPASQS